MCEPLVGDIAAAALEPATDGTSMDEGVVQRIVAWESMNLPVDDTLLHLWADVDRSEAYLAGMRMAFQNEVGTNDTKDRNRRTPLDRAIAKSSSGI